MREGKPSWTAAAVSAARAAGPQGVDPIAVDILPAGPAFFVRATAKAPQWAARVVSLGITDHVRLRTRAIDRELEIAAASGAVQLVILGAGLDTRAFRLAAVESMTVFEVDHPATQKYKREALRGRAPRAAHFNFVPVDFERDDLDACLARAGHDANAATFWIWEGVTMYLERDALTATLEVMQRRSRGDGRSRAAITYVTPELTSFGRFGDRIVKRAFAVAGEAFRNLLSPEEMAGVLSRHGWTALVDESPRAWAARFEPSTRPWLFAVRERLVVAERQ